MSNIDIQSVNEDINFIKKLIDDNSIEIKGISYGKQFRLLRLIENILTERKQDKKRIKELEEKNKTLKNFTESIFNGDVTKDFIPVQKVKDKIKELKERIKKSKKHKEDKLVVNYINAEYLLDKIEKRLLEDK